MEESTCGEKNAKWPVLLPWCYWCPMGRPGQLCISRTAQRRPQRPGISVGAAVWGGCLPRSWPSRRVVSTMKGLFLTKVQPIPVDSPGLLTKGTLSTCGWSNCKTAYGCVGPLPLGTHGLHTMSCTCAQLCRVSSSSAKPRPWLAREGDRCAYAAYREGTHLTLAQGLGTRPFPSSRV